MASIHTAPKSLDTQPKTMMQRFLDGVEKVGNMVPHPVVIFLILIAIVIVLSAVLSLFGAAVTLRAHQSRIRTRSRPRPRRSAAC